MKRIICIALVLVGLIGCLTACNFTANIGGALADKAESTPKVEEMMLALAEDRLSDAKSLMHPQAAEKSAGGLSQVGSYLNGRKIGDMALTNVNISASTGMSGKVRQEQVVYQITLTDGEVIHINAVYLSNNDGSGFISFQLVLGAI